MPKKASTKPLGQLFSRDNPLTWIDRITDAIDHEVRCAEVRIAAKNRKIKKTGASADANAPVIDKGLHELPVNSASWVVNDLLDLQLIIGHGKLLHILF